jgi:hypothetical protein
MGMAHLKKKAVPVHAMNIYRGRRGLAPFILNLDTNWM